MMLRWFLFAALLLGVLSSPAPLYAQAAGTSLPVVRAIAYGARPNDGIDDSQQLVDALAAAGSGVCLLDPGQYDLSPAGAALLTTLVVNNRGTLRGAGMGATLIKLASGKTGIAFRMGSQSTLADLTIEGNDEANTIGAACVSGGSTAGIVYSRVRFKDLNYGSSDNGVMTAVAHLNCEWESNVTFDFVTLSASRDILIVGGRMLSSGATAGIDLQNAPAGVIVCGVQIEGQTTGITLQNAVNAQVFGCRINCTSSITSNTPVRCAIGENTYVADEILPSDVTNKQCRLLGRYYGTAAPSAGTWLTGDVVDNSTPGSTPATAVQWKCSTGGTSGTWRDVYRSVAMIGGSVTWDPGALNNGESVSTSVAITGGTVGDTCIVSHSQNLPNGLILFGQVISSTEVEVSLCNIGGGAAQDVASGTLYVRVLGQ